MSGEQPFGWSYNPSAWRHRLPVLLLSLTGGGIAVYLTLYQLGIVSEVWEPFFGEGSRRILKESAIAHALPVPDALLGAVAYFAEAILELIGGTDRWRRHPWVVLLLGAVAVGLGLTGVALVLCQAFVFQAFCTLCLASAACSVLIFFLAISEVRATWHHLRHGGSARQAV